MKYLNNFEIYEKLYFSLDVFRIINTLVNENDPIAHKLEFVNDYEEIYDTDEDVNFLHLGDEINKIYFTPKTKRVADLSSASTNLSTGLMPTKIGRLVNKILDKASINLRSKMNTECIIKKSDDVRRGEYYVNIDERSIPLSMQFTGPDNNPSQCRHFNLKINDRVITGQVVSANYSSIFSQTNIRNVNNFPNNPRSVILSFNTQKSIPDAFLDKVFLCEIEFYCDLYKNDAEIESFVNKVIAILKVNKATSDTKVQEVSGEEIRRWYLFENYASGRGELGNSCMSYPSCQPYLDLYCLNPDKVSLLVLLNSENKLIARALKWKLDNGDYFIDRIYTFFQSDKIIIMNFARTEAWFYYDRNRIFFDGAPVDKELSVKLGVWDLKYYPYLDTLDFLDMDTGILSTYPDNSFGQIRRLKSTKGSFS